MLGFWGPEPSDAGASGLSAALQGTGIAMPPGFDHRDAATHHVTPKHCQDAANAGLCRYCRLVLLMLVEVKKRHGRV